MYDKSDVLAPLVAQRGATIYAMLCYATEHNKCVDIRGLEARTYDWLIDAGMEVQSR